MMETEYLDLKDDIMWSGNACDRKCSDNYNYKMESLMNKSSFSNDNFNDLYFNLCGSQMFNSMNQEPIDFLDTIDSDDFNVNDLLLSNTSTNTNNNSTTTSLTTNYSIMNTNSINNVPTINPNQATNMNNLQLTTNYYQSQPNYTSSSSLQTTSNTVQTTTTNQMNSHQSNVQTTTDQIVNSSAIKLSNNQVNSFNQTNINSNVNYSSNQSTAQSSSLLNSSLNNEKNSCYLNDLLLSSSSANIILTQHNQPVDSHNQLSQLNSNHQIAYTRNNSIDNLDSLNNLNTCTDLVVCSPDDSLTSTVNHTTQINTQNHINQNHYNNYQINNLNQNGSMMSNYAFDNHHLMDSAFGSDSGSSNNSECSSSILLERTDYDTDDIEDDLDLLEDIIEEECDDNLFTHHSSNNSHHTYNQTTRQCRSIANSLESSSDVDMSIASPISDSLINDHSYGASSIDKTSYDKLTTNSYAVNTKNSNLINNSSNVTITTSSNHRQTTPLIHHINHSNGTNRITKRKSTNNFNNHQTSNSSTNRRNLQRHSGTSLLMKDKQSKMKKVMDTDRRKEHNESERMRRDILKNAFALLRSRCPKLANSSKKSSRIQILNEATFYIKQINGKCDELKVMKDQEKSRHEMLRLRLKELQAGGQ